MFQALRLIHGTQIIRIAFIKEQSLLFMDPFSMPMWSK